MLRRCRPILFAAIVALLAACSDARFDKLQLGMGKDSVFTAMGVPPHRQMSYFEKGHIWEVQLYPRSQADPHDSIDWHKLSPVIYINGKAVGWGWRWWDEASARNNIGMPKKS